MNRFLVAPAAPRAGIGGEKTPVPSGIADVLRSIPPQGALGGAVDIFAPHTEFDGRTLEWASPDVEARANAFEEEILVIQDARPPGYPLLGRVFEYSVRLASIHAVSRGGAFAKVGHDDLEWGAAWALESARSMMVSAASLMVRTDYEEKVNAVSAAIREAGEMPRGELLRACRHINAREMDSILKQLGEMGEVGARLDKRTKPKTVYSWIG